VVKETGSVGYCGMINFSAKILNGEVKKMAARIITTFLFGVAFATSWWSWVMWFDFWAANENTFVMVPILFTVMVIAAGAFWVSKHWDDK